MGTGCEVAVSVGVRGGGPYDGDVTRESEERGAALAIDSGQTGIKVRIVGGRFEKTFPGVQTNRAVLPQLAEAVVASARELGTPLSSVAIGTSGLTDSENDPGRLLELCADAGTQALLLAHDSVTSYLGALGAREGVVVAAGTGVVTLGAGPRGMARVDGWGNIMGDAGSGYWMGREALDAVMRAFDGRGPQTALTPVVQARFPRLDQAYTVLQADPDRVRLVAGYARSVSELAATDEVAARICRRAGEELACSALAAVARAGLGAEAPICFVGSIFFSDAVRAACVAAIRGGMPGVQFVEPLSDGLGGAEALLTLPDSHPLASHVSRAGL